MKAALLVQPKAINLTSSIINHRARMESDLMSGLDKFVIGQKEAKQAIVQTLIEGLYDINREQGVLGAVFLAGPTGVGKTELARAISFTLLGDASYITKISAETMPHPADIARMVGSPSGYIGYGDTPEMADTRVHHGYKMAKEKGTLHPLIQGYNAINFSVVLVDEAEKAHPDIMNSFLGTIQTGEMPMASGKESDQKIKHSKNTDLRNTLFIFTSNTGEHAIAASRANSIGFTKNNNPSSGDMEIFNKELKRMFAPEFLRRMDATIRCHSLSEDELRQVFELHKERMNQALASRQYFSSLRVTTTQSYVDAILSSGGLEYGAGAVKPAIKRMRADTGMAIESGRIPKNADGILEFDMIDGETMLTYRDSPHRHNQGISSNSISNTSVPEHTKNMVEGKINRFGDQVRGTVQSYLNLIAGYDSGFADTCRILEKRLRGFGFNTSDIHSLQAVAFIALYQTVVQPANYEIIVRYDTMFAPVGFRAIEKFIRNAIIQSFSLENIYQTIRVLIKRPMTKNESIVVSQHIHRLLQGKPRTQN